MTNRFLAALAFAFGTMLASVAHAASVAEQCVADLDDARAFIAANDAGAAIALADHGESIARAYDAARTAAAAVPDGDACWSVLNTYLGAWRHGHLNVGRTAQDKVFRAMTPPQDKGDGVDPRAPRLQALDADTLLLTLPTFGESYGGVMRKFMVDQRAVLRAHRNWIIDVRNNDGGADETFQPLLPWLLDGEWRGEATEYFVTPANIQAQEDVCALVSDKAGCQASMAPIVARMRAAPAGSFVLPDGQRVFTMRLPSEPMQPLRVAVLIDRQCGSSCEQFVLAARLGFHVKVLGRPTGGMLDVSNLRPHALPSGRPLYYATTRSTRLPAMRIDGIGIPPDILLEQPADAAGMAAEVERVRRWIEGGSLGDAPRGK